MKKVLLIILSFGSFASCNKSTSKLEVNVQNISGNYILKDLRMSATGVPEQDAYSTVKECVADDLYELKPDQSFEYIDTGVVCTPSTLRYEDTWKLEGDQISFYGQTGTITKFDGNTMEVTSTTNDAENVYVTKSTYEKQE